MSSRIVLDTTPLGILCQSPRKNPVVGQIRAWVLAHRAAGGEVFIPEIADYEVRRELLRAGLSASVMRLDALHAELTYLPLTTAIIRRAAELWAQARNQGRATADPKALDGDVILAAQAEAAGAVVATENPIHFAPFVTAKSWRDLPP